MDTSELQPLLNTYHRKIASTSTLFLRYLQWSETLKNIYDAYPSMSIVYPSSSLLLMDNARVDLSRRACFSGATPRRPYNVASVGGHCSCHKHMRCVGAALRPARVHTHVRDNVDGTMPSHVVGGRDSLRFGLC